METLLQEARQRDRDDPLKSFRDRYWIPRHENGQQAYFCGHSLGLQPRSAEADILAEMEAWRELGVAGHFQGDPPWLSYSEQLKPVLGNLLGAKPEEIAVMNTLTVNLHLMLASFFRPEGRRRKILIEKSAFPSDRYAVVSQLRWHGLEPDECLVEAGNGDGATVEESAVESLLERHAGEIALLLWPGVQYISGQAFDIAQLSAAARSAGAVAGFDLAHAAGNLPLDLHGSGADFAAWCHYKYLNAGPGAIAGCFVHERHHGSDMQRLEGWWGNDVHTRFRMAPEFSAAPGAEAWQLSTPPLLSIAPLKAALESFQEAGIERLRTKSVALTGWLQSQIELELGRVLEIVTPADPQRRGCQLSLRVRDGRESGRSLFGFLEQQGVVCDWREPDIIRVAPVPMYNRYEDVYRFINAARTWAQRAGAA